MKNPMVEAIRILAFMSPRGSDWVIIAPYVYP